MDPILKIVNYLLKKKNIDTTINSFNSFFDNGIDFPRFVATVFNVNSIPNVNKNPKTIYHREVNNSLTLQYLFKNNAELAKISPTFNTERDKVNLIALILTKQCFKIDYQDIISKCNLIVRPLGIQFSKKSDILDKKCILALLNVLTDGQVKMDDEAYTFDDLMNQSFSKAKVHLVINKTSLEIQNQFTFFIQILIIFDTFSDKIYKLAGFKEEISKTEEEEKNEKQKNEEKTQKNETEKQKELNFNSDSEYKDIDNANNSALLNVLNTIGESEGVHFSNINQTVENDNLQKFVKILLKERSDFEAIDNITKEAKTATDKITNIIKYLGETRNPNEPLFHVLRFNFSEQKYFLPSTVMFYTNFLNVYFLKETHTKLFERCSTIIFGSIDKYDAFYLMYLKNFDKERNPYNDINLLQKWDTYLALANFVNLNSTHYLIDRSKKDDFYFKQNNIPQIINRNFLNHFVKKVPDIVYYQLQFIFNVLDTKGFAYKLHERFLKVERSIKKVNVPQFNVLSEKIKLKFNSLTVIKNRYMNESNQEDAKTFIQRELKDSQLLKESQKNTPKTKPEVFWNPVDKSTFLDKGVLCKEKNDIRAQRQWFDEIINFHNNVRINNYTNDKSPTLFTSVQIENVKSNLYKFFYYDEDLKKWQMDSNCIKQFISDKKYDKAKVRTPLVLFSNAYEKDLIMINSKFINTIYPDLDDDNIYIYALSDKDISLLRYNVTSNDDDKDSVEDDAQIKPIFLLLHVPKIKQKSLKSDDDIKIVLFKIFYFLSIICDIEVVVLNKDHCLEQLEFIKEINNVKRSYENSATEKLHKGEKISNDENEMSQALSKADFNIWKKKSKYIVLLNDDTIQGDIIEPEDSDFVGYVKAKIFSEFVKIHHINTYDPFTFRGFLTSLTKFASKVDTVFKQTLESLDLYPITDISSVYINLKSKDEWKAKLTYVIDTRFNQLVVDDCGESNDFSILSKLNKEVSQFYPPIDSEFNEECISNFNKIRHLLIQKNRRFIKLQLILSSKNSLDDISKKINKDSSESEIEDAHRKFLSDEFSNIINKLFEKEDQKDAFDNNRAILDNQIQKDVEKIHKIIDSFNQ